MTGDFETHDVGTGERLKQLEAAEGRFRISLWEVLRRRGMGQDECLRIIGRTFDEAPAEPVRRVA